MTSFVNADQFVQLLRSVAANAKGYAFQLALSAMCEKCSQHMETLQKKIQQLNEYFGNSCQMAQGVVNDTLAAFGKKGQTEASMLSSLKGAGDVFTSWSESNGKNPYENASSVAGPVTKAVLAAERKKSRQLEKELRRKEKALAETAALLTLSKKARAIWGNDEED
ncbi:conjugal transfer protein TraH [Oligella urethralis]|uniref:conjugal transfer protein TraH n=1 Tax=Oligella urethralis TaxID=90245 RepID=UPI001C68CAE2|nr:conjugal transfer protein TraH [Oligella urethralis]